MLGITSMPNLQDWKPGRQAGALGGLRITVYDVLSWLADGMSRTEIVEDFPELTDDDITACLQFAADKSSS